MTHTQVVATSIFVVTFVVILSERLHRTIAAMAGAAVMLAAGMLMGFYSQEEALAAIDFNTLALLLGMMILVRLLQQTGFFRYAAILTAKRTKGNPLLLFVALGALTTVLSMFLDNVTTVVLIAPVTILLAEILGISPIPLLMAEALLSDTGGVATLVGDPPNVVIGSAAGFSFTSFLTHLAPVVLVAWLVAGLVLWFVFRREFGERPSNVRALMQLDENEGLHDRAALRRTLIVLGGVIFLFFFQGALNLAPGAIALGGAAAGLLWVRPDVEETLRRVEWGVLLFFGALFVAVGGLEASGVLEMVADQIVGFADASLLGASLLMLWVAAIISAVVDNIPFTIALVPVIDRLGSLGINVVPLWWALALGAGFGGNGTPIGSTANVVTVALSEKTRTPITTRIWLRSGLPVMLATCMVATVMFILFFGRMQTH
jgi:Na+/H+ antiporter NhaD/arsenite permease-like protein